MKRPTMHCIIFTAAFLVACSGVSTAASLRVHFSQFAEANAQAGWIREFAPSPPLTVNVVGGEYDGVSVSAIANFVRDHTTDGYSLIDHTDGDLDNMLSGGVLVNLSNQLITLNLSGLADGVYNITTYHHTIRTTTNGGIFDVRLTDGLVTNSTVHNDVPFSFGASVTTAGIASLTTSFTVTGGTGATTTLVMDPEAAGFDGSGLDQLMLNGFELAPIPEPSGVALVLVGMAGAVLQRRRR